MSGEIFHSLAEDKMGSRRESEQHVSHGVEMKHRLYRASSFRNCYRKENKDPLSIKERFFNRRKNLCSCDSNDRNNFFHRMFPFFKIMKKYKWKTALLHDIIAGLTVGVMLLPQGVAFAMLAELPPMVGLYLSFFPVIIYFFLGTSRHINIGPVAVISLMVGSVVLRYEEDVIGVSGDRNYTHKLVNTTDSNSSMVLVTMPTHDDGLGAPSLSESDITAKKIGIATTICIMCGVFQVVLGLLRLGLVTTYMSEPLIRGFTTGVAVHVFTSQVKTILGLRVKRFPGLFHIVNTYRAIIENISQTNVAELVMSLIFILIIYMIKVQVNLRFKKKLKIPIPIELIVVIIATVASHFGRFGEVWKIRIVGYIPAGLPSPSPPSFYDAASYISDAISIAIVAFAQSISLVTLLAKRNHYESDANQELIAYGLSNIFGSFFSCYPMAASLSRSTVQEATGGKTQVASLTSAALILIVILWIGTLFESLPNCALSAIIVVALRGMFLQLFDLKQLWKTSLYDFFIWLVTFLGVVVLHVDYGLLIGILFSFYTVILRTQRTKAKQLELLSDVGVFKDSSKYVKTQGNFGIRVIGYDAPLYYANADMFVGHIHSLTGVVPERYRKIIRKYGSLDAFRRVRTVPTVNGDYGVEIIISGQHSATEQDEPLKQETTVVNSVCADAPIIYYIIIDFSSVSFIDTAGVKVLKMVFEEYKTVGINVVIAGVSDDIWTILQGTGFLEKYGDSIYLSVHDAVRATSMSLVNQDDVCVTKSGDAAEKS